MLAETFTQTQSTPRVESVFDPLQYASQIEAWVQAATDGTTLVPEGESQQDPDGNPVQEVKTPEGLTGAAAIVTMHGEPDSPHYHDGDEVEIHYPLSGSAQMSMNGKIAQLALGIPVAVAPGTSHFIIPGEGFSELVISLPEFDEANLKDADAQHPHDTVLYDHLTS